MTDLPAESLFDRVVAYVARFDPRFPDAILAATPEQITELESLTGAPLPPVYSDFLSHMGRSTDWISVRRMDLRIETVLDYYRRERWLPADRFLRIGTELDEPALHPFLQLDPFGGDPAVVCMRAVRPEAFEEVTMTGLDPLAGSLQELVAMPVFRMFELRAGGRVPAILHSRQWRPEAWEGVETAMEAAGLARLWFSSETGRAYSHAGAAVAATQHLGYPMQIAVGTDDRDARDALINALTRQLPDLARVA